MDSDRPGEPCESNGLIGEKPVTMDAANHCDSSEVKVQGQSQESSGLAGFKQSSMDSCGSRNSPDSDASSLFPKSLSPSSREMTPTIICEDEKGERSSLIEDEICAGSKVICRGVRGQASLDSGPQSSSDENRGLLGVRMGMINLAKFMVAYYLNIFICY